MKVYQLVDDGAPQPESLGFFVNKESARKRRKEIVNERMKDPDWITKPGFMEKYLGWPYFKAEHMKIHTIKVKA